MNKDLPLYIYYNHLYICSDLDANARVIHRGLDARQTGLHDNSRDLQTYSTNNK